MDFTISLYIIFASIVSASCNMCTIIRTHNDACTYTVECRGHAGSASNPSCDDPYVTFVIRDSSTDTLTTGFFGSTNFDSRVRNIQAISNIWFNIESFAFKYYAKSLVMDLSNNNIRNIKNDAFRNLFVLNFLNLSRNAIESLNPASFAIADTPKLTKLDLSYNMLAEIPSEPFSYLPSLLYLYLENNRLTNLAEDCFTSLKNLSGLNLSNNKLTALNLTLMNLKSLQALDLSFNNLLKLSSFEINRAGALLLINMSYNAIETVESNCFNQAFNLRRLDLSNNKIESPIENIMFVNNNQLETLNFYNNCIERIDDDAFKHTSLTNLDLKRNCLKGDISGKMLSGVQNVTTLDFFNQSITAIRDYAFSSLANLVYLNLSRNFIDTIEKKAFINTTALQVLDISYNNVSNLEFLNGSLSSLTELYLNNNSLVVIGSYTFLSYQVHLKKLDLSNNRIITIEPFSLPVNTIEYLNVTGNNLQGVLRSNVLGPSNFIRFVDLSGFNISKVDNEAVVNSPLLARVNLSHNAIEYIGPKNFYYLENLYSLDLSYNKLNKLQIYNSNLFNLKALYLNNNRLQSIRNSFSNISQILYLDISNNNITELSDPIFQTLHDLRVLQVSNNKIVNFNNPQTNSLTKLMTLSVSSNLLTNLNLSYFPDLINVDLSNNSIGYINSSFFQNLDHLQSIDLSYNKLSKLPPGTFQSLKILKVLNVSANSIKSLRYGSFKGLNRTEVIDLSRNDIHVLDVDVFHECTELKRLIIDYNFITQIDFERLILTVSKLNALSLGGNPILCMEIVRHYSKGFVRRIEVTSIDKVFEEDNVHGIWCGGTMDTTPASVTVLPTEPTGHSVSSLLIIWCMVLTILIIAVGIGSFIYKNKRVVVMRALSSRSNTMEFSGSAFNTDLLN